MSASTPSFREAFGVWARIGCLGFGGPAGQIALLHREVVERRGWLDEERFRHALGFCMLLPGPEAQQLATYVGWLMHGVRGGLAAGLMFVLPGFAVIVALSWLYAAFGTLPDVAAVFLGVKAAVVAIVLQALLRLGRKGLTDRLSLALAGAAFFSLAVLNLPFPMVVLAAGVIGAVAARGNGGPVAGSREPGLARRTLLTAVVWTAAWLVPVAAVVAGFGADSVVARMGVFFAQAAAVTFGGAYAVLAYVAQAVEQAGWLAHGQMLDGLGLAETTPGPLILVLVFVGFVGAWQAAPPGLEAVWALAAAGITAWAIFAPSFLWIFAGAPHMERLRSAARLTGALGGVSAAVVGVVASLALWFALRLLFAETAQARLGPIPVDWPELASFQPVTAALVALACALALPARLGVPPLLAVMALAGWTAGRLGLA